MTRRILLLVATLASLFWLASGAMAAGLSGVELTPDKGPTDRSPGPATAFHLRVPDGGQTTSGFALRNLTNEPRTVRLYGAAASGTPATGIKVAGPGGAPWIGITDQSITLAGGESRRIGFTATDPGGEQGTESYGAVVLEVQDGSVVTRAATVVYAEVGPPPTGLRQTVSLLLAALGVISIVGAAAFLVRRVGSRWSRRSTPTVPA